MKKNLRFVLKLCILPVKLGVERNQANFRNFNQCSIDFIRSHKLNLFGMNITFNELRKIKHSLPTGSVGRIAKELNIDEQAVRDYFGAAKFNHDKAGDWHLEPGPDGGIVHLEDTRILEAAQRILAETSLN